MEHTPLLGILGGLGPMSTVYFYEMLTAHTRAASDQEHLNIIISSHAATPDRTRYILGLSAENPLETMVEDAHKLQAYGAELLAIPCNTAHYFYRELSQSVDVPILNIIEETVALMSRAGVSCVGVLATDGTVHTESYQKVCAAAGIRCEIPKPAEQAALMEIIYGEIKEGRRADMVKFSAVAQALLARGCERLILGCTELSLIRRDEGLDDRYVDSLEALAHRTILACGKVPVGFPAWFDHEA